MGKGGNVRSWGLLLVWSTSVLLLLLPAGEAIWVTLPAKETKCLSERIQTNVVVLADYLIVSDDHGDPTPTISVKVTSPYGSNIHHQENMTYGQLAFTTKESGSYLACFWIDGHNEGDKDVSVSLSWKTGVAAKDWESVARREKIEGVELELIKLEGAVESIHENLVYLRGREAEMRSVSERTNTRVALFSAMSLGICIVVSIMQLWYLKQFFQRRKLI
ncbi:transmembrane emp24 domain-containing protein p24delta4-like [Diospyros lotus]|uniref:transmembrane emp24 domain-containing protein p24delta4-like n=1 Tax=Diospyros lotus TaxID=55363 RepID=UPI002250F46A|nr:transmembrane emp24 domain-containing protein p24delta4-like [Diospyros lotus]